MVLADPELRARWEAEVTEMRQRIQNMRALFVRRLAERGIKRDFSFIAQQKGMFLLFGSGPERRAAPALRIRSVHRR
jgi:aspartate/tyrosine/aromatic aminotransferase